jgi:hypothetical protein
MMDPSYDAHLPAQALHGAHVDPRDHRHRGAHEAGGYQDKEEADQKAPYRPPYEAPRRQRVVKGQVKGQELRQQWNRDQRRDADADLDDPEEAERVAHPVDPRLHQEGTQRKTYKVGRHYDGHAVDVGLDEEDQQPHPRHLICERREPLDTEYPQGHSDRPGQPGLRRFGSLLHRGLSGARRCPKTRGQAQRCYRHSRIQQHCEKA